MEFVGRFGTAPLDEATVRRLGAALGADLVRKAAAPRVVLGGDTRDSTPILCSWLAAELRAQGAEVQYLGTVPTPGVTFSVLDAEAAAGIAVSASHNPHPDNGIKLIDSTGFKWSPKAEVMLEERMEQAEVSGGQLQLEIDGQALEAYRQALLATLDGRRLEGLKIILDVGFGAAAPFARDLFDGLGAAVTVLHDQPDGCNINLNAGSTHPEALAAAVKDARADLGIAFDGDADRAIVVDDQGEVRDGDAILFLWGRDLNRRGMLPESGVVATTMSNLGLEVALRREGIDLIRCGVGDREVVATLRERGLALGGEQSGHIVNLALSTTGDGLLTALQLADLRVRSDKALSQMLAGFERFPQLLRNLPVRHKPPLDSIPSVVAAARRVKEELADQGRLVLRYSGTESLVRIMIEGADRQGIEALADRLAEVLNQELA